MKKIYAYSGTVSDFRTTLAMASLLESLRAWRDAVGHTVDRIAAPWDDLADPAHDDE